MVFVVSRPPTYSVGSPERRRKQLTVLMPCSGKSAFAPWHSPTPLNDVFPRAPSPYHVKESGVVLCRQKCILPTVFAFVSIMRPSELRVAVDRNVYCPSYVAVAMPVRSWAQNSVGVMLDSG